MERILLLEANYRNKFPPIGLMKLATYHSRHQRDLVWFAKGRVDRELTPDKRNRIKASLYYQRQYGEDLDSYLDEIASAITGSKWDRVYVTTLFTFEWEKTIRLIEYAKTLVDSPDKIFVGGVAATLMPEEFEKATGIKPMTGLIKDSSELGYAQGVCVDMLTPDYSILEHIDYEYGFANGYFLTATRGCGNRCSFCAVQTLEPEYQDYLPIKPRIDEIRELYGEKRNLYLLDNNVLKSRQFESIIEDIKEAGFGKGATWLNPATNKTNKRFVDFNQGLDSKFLTEEKAQMLGEIALDPAHIAFDHIAEEPKYRRAVALMDKHDVRNVSSYLLYNTGSFDGKGSRRKADTPQDLYERMRIGYALNKTINENRGREGKLRFDCFSFPMRCIPLNAKDRSFVGDNWTKRTLAGVRTMLQPSKGGVYPTEDYFEYMYGNNYEEFLEILLMPHEYIRHKGKPANKYPDGEHPNKKWLLCITEWQRLFRALSEEEKAEFQGIIADNEFTVGTLARIKHSVMERLYLHYFTGIRLPEMLKQMQMLSVNLQMLDKTSTVMLSENPPVTQVLEMNSIAMLNENPPEKQVLEMNSIAMLSENPPEMSVRTRGKIPPEKQSPDKDRTVMLTQDSRLQETLTQDKIPPVMLTTDEIPPTSQSKVLTPPVKLTQDLNPPEMLTQDLNPPEMLTSDLTPPMSQSKDLIPPELLTHIIDYIMYECPSILWCSLELCSKRKNGQEQAVALLGTLFPNKTVHEKAV